MVRRILTRLTGPVRGFVMRPARSVHQAAYVLAALTLASQALALLRDRTFAHLFGAGQVLDLYYAAFRVPDLVFALVSSLVSAYVLIPKMVDMDRQSVHRLLSESATFLFGVGGVLCVLLGIWMPQFLTWLYPDLVMSAQRDAFILLSRILLLQPLLLGISGVLGSVTQVHRRFTLFALSPVLYNVGIILGTVVFYPRYGLPGIGVGVILGAIAYMAVNIPVVVHAGVLPQFRLPRMATMGAVVRDSIPRSLALGMGSVTLLVLTAIASRMGTGAVSVFTFASNLEAVPLGLIGASYAVAAFPALSEASALERREEFTTILSSSARHIILWSLAALGLIVVLRAHIVRIILGTGAFDWNATRLTAALLVVLAVGLVAQGLILLFSRALYAVRQSWRPLIYQLLGGLLTVGLAFLFLETTDSHLLMVLGGLLKVESVPGTSILLVALAATLGQIALMLLSLIALRTTTPGLGRALIRPFLDGLLAAVVGGAAAYAVLVLEGGIAPLTTFAAVLVEGLIAFVVGGICIGGALVLVGNEECKTMIRALRKIRTLRGTQSSVLAPLVEEPL